MCSPTLGSVSQLSSLGSLQFEYNSQDKKGFPGLSSPIYAAWSNAFLIEMWHPWTSAAQRQSCSYAGDNRSKTRRRTEQSWKQEPKRKRGAPGGWQLAQGPACSCLHPLPCQHLSAWGWIRQHLDGQWRELWLALWSRIITIWALQVWVSFHWNKLLKSMMNINIVGTRGKAVNCSRMKYLHLIMSNYIEFERVFLMHAI